jgi:hypothetical protein
MLFLDVNLSWFVVVVQTVTRLPWRPCRGQVRWIHPAGHVFLCISSIDIGSGNVVHAGDSELFDLCFCLGPEHEQLVPGGSQRFCVSSWDVIS